MALRGTRFRATALLAGCAFAVHQLRYLLAYGGGSGERLSHEGHSYLAIAGPVIAAAMVVALIEFGLRLARARPRRRSQPLPGGPGLWAVASASLLALYTVQESVEATLAQGHPSGLEGLFGNGGWLVFLLVLSFGGLAALALRGAAAIERRSTRRRRPPRRRAASFPWVRARDPRPSSDPIATHLAGRSPPPIAAAL
jgi:hypothetical protein